MPHAASHSGSFPASPPQRVLTFAEARHRVEEIAAKTAPVETEPLELLLGPRRVLAEEVHADRDFPPFPRAARDGYAVRASDLAQLPAELRVVGEVRAGSAPDVNLAAGQAASIMTGAAVPPGADAVVMVEHTSRDTDRVLVERRVAAGENIVPAGSEGRRGDQLLAPGARMAYAEIAISAAAGRSRVLVFDEPRIAVL